MQSEEQKSFRLTDDGLPPGQSERDKGAAGHVRGNIAVYQEPYTS